MADRLESDAAASLGMARGTGSSQRCSRTRTRSVRSTGSVSVDSTIYRAHQHGTNLTLPGGRPPMFDAEAYKDRNVIERSLNILKQCADRPLL